MPEIQATARGLEVRESEPAGSTAIFRGSLSLTRLRRHVVIQGRRTLSFRFERLALPSDRKRPDSAWLLRSAATGPHDISDPGPPLGAAVIEIASAPRIARVRIQAFLEVSRSQPEKLILRLTGRSQ